MSEVRSLKKFKEDKKLSRKAKVYIEHIEASLKVINLTLQGLSHFELYSPVHSILVTMRFEKKNLEKMLKEQREILGSKYE